MPSRIMLLVLIGMLNLSELIFWNPMFSSFYLTAGLGFVFIISIPSYLYKKISFNTLLNIPSAVFNMTKANISIFSTKGRIVEVS